MCMLSHRLQLLLDDERFEQITTLARQRHTSVAAVIREAIDRGLPADPVRRAAAAERILTATPAPVGGPEELREELHRLRGRHE